MAQGQTGAHLPNLTKGIAILCSRRETPWGSWSGRCALTICYRSAHADPLVVLVWSGPVVTIGRAKECLEHGPFGMVSPVGNDW